MNGSGNSGTEGQQIPLFGFDKVNLEKVKRPEDRIQTSDFGKYIIYVDESGDHNLQRVREG